jgi:penicillin-binding protein 1A
MGAITLRKALALSRNVVAVKLVDQVGLDRVISYAHRMGVQSQLDANLSLALGSSVVTLLDQASGYGTIANQGVHVELTPFRTVRDLLGNVVLNNQYPQSQDVVSAGTAYIVTTMLQDVIAYGTGTNANIGRPAAGKTGTTSSFRDAWFVGFTPDLVTAVWLGNDDYARMNESYGGNIPARIWARFMRAALAKTPPHQFVQPSDEVVKLDCGGITDYHLSSSQNDAGCGTAHAAPVSVNLPPPVELPHNGGTQVLATPTDLPSIPAEETVPPDDATAKPPPPAPLQSPTPRAQDASDLPSPP